MAETREFETIAGNLYATRYVGPMPSKCADRVRFEVWARDGDNEGRVVMTRAQLTDFALGLRELASWASE